MNQPRLSVITPVYNVENYLRGSVDSVLNQTFADLELILVDDGSTDSCGQICDEYASSDPRVRVIHQEHEGVSDARNKGIDIARGKLIGFADSDDEITETMYQEMIDYLESNQLDAVCTDTYVVRNGKKTFRPRYKKDMLFNHDEAINEILEGALDNAVWNKIYKREVVGDIRFPAGRIYEDVATVYKFINRAERVGYLCKPLYYYIKRKNSITNTSFNSNGRYDCFCSYWERADFAEKQKLNCIDKCKAQALKTALNTLTAFYADNESSVSDKYLAVAGFLNNYAYSEYISLLNIKHRMLMYSFKYCPSVHRFYAFLSAAAKKIQG